jgi:hypothetical protein
MISPPYDNTKTRNIIIIIIIIITATTEEWRP